MEMSEKNEGLGIAGLVLGILSISIGWFVGVLGILMGIFGIILSVKQSKIYLGGITIAGLITSIVGAVISSLALLVWMLLITK